VVNVQAKAGRAHRPAAETPQPLGEHHRVGGPLAQRHHRLQDQGVGLRLVEGHQAVFGILPRRPDVGSVQHPVVVAVLPVIQHPVAVLILIGGVEQEVAGVPAGIGGVVAVRDLQGQRVVLPPDVEKHGLAVAGASGIDVDQIDRVVFEVQVVAVAGQEILYVQGGVE
jgi:hypothetical protein